MAVNQNVRSNPTENNPSGFLNDVLNIGRILVNDTPPISTSGNAGDYFIDNSSGDLYGKKSISGEWGPPIYNFAGGGGGGTLTNLANVGTGLRSYKGLNGTVAELRTITTTANQIDGGEFGNEINLSMNANYKPDTLSLISNFPHQCGLGSASLNPNGLFGAPEYNQGSIFIQPGSPSTIWICQNPASKIWTPYDASSGVSNIVNASAGATVLKDITGGVATLRTIQGEISKIAVLQASNYLIIDILSSYRPETLSNILENKRFGFGSLSAPTVNDDSSSGYAVGSLFTEIELGGTNRIWLCRSASPGSAVWQEFTGSGSGAQKDYIQWTNNGIGYSQFITGSLQDWNAGPNVTEKAKAVSSHFSTSFDGTRQIFTRSPVSNSKSYMITFSCITLDVAGATSSDSRYLFNMIRKNDGHRFGQSFNAMIISASSAIRHNGSVSFTFIINEPSNSTVSYYFQLIGQNDIGGSPGVAPSYNCEEWGISFMEI